jgi:hypothetical protein
MIFLSPPSGSLTHLTTTIAHPYIGRYFNGPSSIIAAKSAPEIPVAAGKQNTFSRKNFQSHIFENFNQSVSGYLVGFK